MGRIEPFLEAPLLLGSQIFQFLREQIITGKLEEGAKLKELSLQEALGTIRSPIREAFCRLEVEGLVETLPRWGAFVRSVLKETEARHARQLKVRLVKQTIEDLQPFFLIS